MKKGKIKEICFKCRRTIDPFMVSSRRGEPETYHYKTINGEISCVGCYSDYLHEKDSQYKTINSQASNKSATIQEKTVSYKQENSNSQQPQKRFLRKPSKEEILKALEENRDIPLPTIVYPEGNIEIDLEEMKRICLMEIDDFCKFEGAEIIDAKKDGNAVFIDRGSPILAVAHRDSVCEEKHFNAMHFQNNDIIYTPTLDDRLGCFIIYNVLPKMGYNFDLLFSEGEEKGRSTAAYFSGPKDRKYNFIIEFDRKEDDVVMYQYEDVDEWKKAWRDAGARIGIGSFSDIGVLGHLGRCAVNIGCGYMDYHGPKAHADMNMLYRQLRIFDNFMKTNIDKVFEFDAKKKSGRWTSKPSYGLYEGNKYDSNRSSSTGNRNSSVITPTRRFSNVPQNRLYKESSPRQLNSFYNHSEKTSIVNIDGETYIVFFDECDALAQLEQQKKDQTNENEKITKKLIPIEDNKEETKEEESSMTKCDICGKLVESDALFGLNKELCSDCYDSTIAAGM